MKKFCSIVLSVMLAVGFSTSVFAEAGSVEQHTEFQYPVTPADKEWAEFTSKQEMLDATDIPTTVLEKMTTDEVLDAVLDFPLIVNLYLYDSYEVALEALAEDSDAFFELKQREDAGEAILGKLSSAKAFNTEDPSLEDRTLNILLTDKSILNSINEKEKANSIVAAASSYVRTPNGTSVPVDILGEQLTVTQKASLNQQTQAAYPSATFVSSSTSNYNCHSYAWYSNTTSNTYWMNNASAYMTDGSYASVTNLINAGIGTRVYYDGGLHSAIVTTNGGPLASPKKLRVTSKWGQGPLMSHTAEYSPYASNALTMWKR
ncbi:hypothetical protein ACE6ED_22780 [Paenibacillus sp. CN-4]|uniref:hypothetical protein n=1 Tax=Paenibacillus nanchangensis TaxID=3348343 RepID=UPI00397AB858